MRIHTLTVLLLLVSTAAIARPGQLTLRSGSVQDPDTESPLTESAKKYAAYLALSNSFMDAILAGKEASLFDTKFSPWLKESMDRSWFLAQFKSIKNLHGVPTSYKKLQWYFIEESIQGKPLVHSVKFVHYGSVVVQFVLTVQAATPGKVIGFQIIPPEDPRETSGEESPAFSSASQTNEDEEKPLDLDTQRFEMLLRSANAFLALLKKGEIASAYKSYFSDTLQAQVSITALEEAQKRTVEFAGPIESWKAGQWMFFVRKYQNNEVIVLRKIVKHANAVMVYNFPVLVTDQEKFIGFQTYVKPGPVQQRFYYLDKDGRKVEAK